MSRNDPWEVTIGGATYVRWIASIRPDGIPDADDEMVLELRDADLEPVLFISHFASGGRLELKTLADDIPEEVLDWARAAALKQWPGSQFPGPVHG